MNSKVGSLIAVFFGAGLLVAPWLLAGNVPPVRTIALGMTFIASLACFLFPSLIGTPTKLGIAMKALLLTGLAFAAIQIIPFGESTISAYPAATRSRMCELILGISAFFVASCVFRDQKTLPWFFGLVALNGVLITFFGLAQNVSNTERLFWFYELIWGGEPFGPFVNANNGGGYLLLCLAAANFFIAQRVFRAQHLNKTQLDGPGKQSTFSIVVSTVGRSFAKLETQQLYILAAIAAIAAGVLATMSRGAAVALLVSLFIGWGLLFRRSLAFGLVSLFVAAAGVGVLAWTQQGGAVVSSLETLADVENTSGNRLVHWKDAWAYAMDSQPLGSGLGTYSIMYPEYQKTWHFKRWFKHAENQYLETFAELGIVGLVILLACIGLVIAGSIRLLSFPDSTSRAVGLSGLIAIVSQIVAGSFDFGLYQPANTLLMASMAGVVFSQLNWGWSAQHVAEENQARGKSRFAWCAMLIVTVLTGWATYEYSGVDAYVAARRFNERFDPNRDRDQVDRYQQLAEYAVKVRPDDADAHFYLAQNYVLQYRLAVSDLMVEELEHARDKIKGDGQDDGSMKSTSVRAVMKRRAFVRTEGIGSLNEEDELVERPDFEEIKQPEFEPNDSEFESLEAEFEVQSGNESSEPAFEATIELPTMESAGGVENERNDFLSVNNDVDNDNDFVAGEYSPAASPVIDDKKAAASDGAFVQDVVGSDRRQEFEPESSQDSEKRNEVLLQMLPEEFNFDLAWESSTLVTLNRLAWASKREGKGHLDDLRTTEPVQKYLAKAWNHFELAEECCDRYWMTPMRLANLSLILNHGEQEEQHLANAIERCPKNSKLLYLVGLSKHNAGKTEEACDYWSKCLNLTREFDETIIGICRNEIGIKAFFDQVLPSEPYFRIRIAKRYFGTDDDLLLKKLLMMHSKSKVDEHELPDAERQYVLAEMERLSQNNAVSMVYFKRALELANHRADWRIQYARTLIDANKYDEAIAELKVCELYQGSHHLVCQRLSRQAKRLRMEQFKDINGLKFGRN